MSMTDTVQSEAAPHGPVDPNMVQQNAIFTIGQVVQHRLFPFRGVIYDVDPEFANTEEWYEAIPAEIRPSKEQPFYHLFAENEESWYEAYVSQQNLLPDDSGEPVNHPDVDTVFTKFKGDHYALRPEIRN